MNNRERERKERRGGCGGRKSRENEKGEKRYFKFFFKKNVRCHIIISNNKYFVVSKLF